MEANDKVVSYFAEPVADYGRAILKIRPDPSCEDQQVLEALAALVALREWSTFWCGERLVLTVRTDNVATLAMVAKMQPKSSRLSLIAREMALDCCQSTLGPDLVQHIPGIANITADALSRKYQLGKGFNLPSSLAGAHEHACSTRPLAWWRTLPAPPK